MRIFSFVLLMFVCLSYTPSYAQQLDTVKVKSLEEAISGSLNSFRKRITNDKAIVYCIVETKLEKKNITLEKNDFFVENGINAKKIDYKTPKYVLNFLISINNGQVFISVIHWGLHKKTNKRINLIDLMTRDYYKVISN